MLDMVERGTEKAFAQLDEVWKRSDRLLPASGPGAHRPSNLELAQFVMQVIQAYPPWPIPRPDGAVVVASSYLEALSRMQNGRQLLQRIQRVTTGGQEVVA